MFTKDKFDSADENFYKTEQNYPIKNQKKSNTKSSDEDTYYEIKVYTGNVFGAGIGWIRNYFFFIKNIKINFIKALTLMFF